MFGAHKRSLCKKRDSLDEAILAPVIKRGRGLLGDATYQIYRGFLFGGEYQIYFIECVENFDVFNLRDDIYLVFTVKIIFFLFYTF